MSLGPTGLPSLEDALRDAMHEERADCMLGPESPEGRELGALVGANVAEQRARRGLELDALAARTAIRADLLRLLEAGQAVPSLRALWALATGLEVSFGTLLVRRDTPASAFRVQPATRGRVIASADNQFRSRALSPAGGPDVPEIYELTLAPGCFEPADAHGTHTFEQLVVVQGTLVVRVGDETARLTPGDALFFRADRAHSYENPGDVPTRVHLVMSYV